MHYISEYIHIILHLNVYLAQLIQYMGPWIYLLLFGIIFCETGIIFTPFLPGESMLFALGTLAASHAFDVHLLVLVLIIAAIAGGMVNYFVGLFVGEKLLPKNKESTIHHYVERTHQFYQRHGGKTIVIARLLPIIRTYAPFVAGIAEMNLVRYSIYNVIGGAFWILIFIYGSYYFGNIPVIKQNFSLVILVIIVISVIPASFEFFRHRYLHKKRLKKTGQ